MNYVRFDKLLPKIQLHYCLAVECGAIDPEIFWHGDTLFREDGGGWMNETGHYCARSIPLPIFATNGVPLPVFSGSEKTVDGLDPRFLRKSSKLPHVEAFTERMNTLTRLETMQDQTEKEMKDIRARKEEAEAAILVFKDKLRELEIQKANLQYSIAHVRDTENE